jgi:hypothetical protein
MSEIISVKRADGTTFQPVVASGEVYDRQQHKPTEPRFDPLRNQAAALYPKWLYRLMDGVEPFTDANAFNRALGHPVGHDPQNNVEIRNPLTHPQQIESMLVHDEVEEQDAVDEGFGPIGTCFASTGPTRTRKTKLELLQAESAAREAAKDAEIAEMNAKLDALLKQGSAPKVRRQRRTKAQMAQG